MSSGQGVLSERLEGGAGVTRCRAQPAQSSEAGEKQDVLGVSVRKWLH